MTLFDVKKNCRPPCINTHQNVHIMAITITNTATISDGTTAKRIRASNCTKSGGKYTITCNFAS